MAIEFNFKSQIATSREQSEKLLALGLKAETADMKYPGTREYYGGVLTEGVSSLPIIIDTEDDEVTEWDIPAWSLHRLLLLIPKEVNIDGYRFPLRSDAVMRMDEADDMYEYLIGVLERTIKEGYFNKEYLV